VTAGGGGGAVLVPPVGTGLAGAVAGVRGTGFGDTDGVSVGVADRGRGGGAVGAAGSAAARDCCVGAGGVASTSGGGLTDVADGSAVETAGASVAGMAARLSEADCPRRNRAAAVTIARTPTRIAIHCARVALGGAVVTAGVDTTGMLGGVDMTTV